MLRSFLFVVAFALSVFAGGSAMAGAIFLGPGPWLTGNDTGGIIPWSPDLRAFGYREAAQKHCDGYHRVARITSVHARYGDYVGFACEFPRGYDPVKSGRWWWSPT